MSTEWAASSANYGRRMQYLSNCEYLSSTFQTVSTFPVPFKLWVPFQYLSNCESIPFPTIQPGYQYLCSTFQTASSLSIDISLQPFLFWNWEDDIVSPIKLWLFLPLSGPYSSLQWEPLKASPLLYMSCQPLGKWATGPGENPCKSKLQGDFFHWFPP